MKLVVLVWAVVLSGSVSALRAEGDSSAGGNSAAAQFERFEAADKALLDALKALRTTYEAEEAAGRLPKKEQGLRSFIEFLEGASSHERGEAGALDFFVRSDRHRSENASVEAALEKLKKSAEARRTLHQQSLAAMVDSAMAESAEAWRGAKRAPDLTPSISRLEKIEEMLESPGGGEPTHRRAAQVRELIDYLDRFRTWLDQSEAADLAAGGAPMQEIHITKSPFGDLVSLKDVQDRTTSGQAQSVAKLDAAFGEMVRLLPKAREPEELEPLLDRLLQSAYIARRVYPHVGENRDTRAWYLAARWMEMLARERDRQWPIVIQLATQSLDEWRQYAPGMVATLETHRAEAERKQKEYEREEQEEFARSLREELEKAGSVQELAAIVEKLDADLRDENGDTAQAQRDPQTRIMLSALVEQARAMEEGRQPPRATGAYLRQAYGPLADLMTPLLEKLSRRALAERTGHPEILEAPLLSLPPEEALEQVAKKLADRGDWRRLYPLLQTRAMRAGPENERGVPSRAAMVRSFLYAQNLEKAELWEEAAANIGRCWGPWSNRSSWRRPPRG